VRQDEEAFRLWSDYVSGFHKDIEKDIKKDLYDENWDRRYLELYERLLEFHFHHDLVDDRLNLAYQDYDGFTNERVIDYLLHSSELSLNCGEDAKAYENDLLRLLIEHFDEGELHTLCRELDVNYDNLAGEVKTVKARQLILSLERDDRVLDLVKKVKQLRPHVSWPTEPPSIPSARLLEDEEFLSQTRLGLSQELLDKLKMEELYNAQ
jgi:hypothetical protein